MITVCRFIRHRQRKWFEARGWTISTLPNHHGFYALLAVRKGK